MSFIDEAAKEINVKIVWYAASPTTAAALVRLIGSRTRPDLRRQQTLSIEDGLNVELLQFMPATLGTIRGFSTRFHLYGIDSPTGALESNESRLLVFRGADACIFVGGPDEAAALARVDAVFAALSNRGVPTLYALENVSAAAAVARGRALGFPDADSFGIDVGSGTGVFEAFKAIAKKILGLLAGNEIISRPTPPPGTKPLGLDAPPTPAANTLETTQEGLDDWQRAYHFKAIWVVGLEEARLQPVDIPRELPAHTVHSVRLTSGDGFAVMTNGFSRTLPVAGAERIELRADAAKHGWQIAEALSMLGRLCYTQLCDGGDPWQPFDLVTTSEQPLFGLSHFALLPGGKVHVGEDFVTILRVVPISTDEHREIAGRIVGEQLAAWFAARAATLPSRWRPVLERDDVFGTA